MIHKIVFVILFFVFSQVLMAEDSDIIPVFFEQYNNGKNVDQIYYMEINIYEIAGKVEWIMNVTKFIPDDYYKVTRVQCENSRSNDSYTAPLLTDIKWERGKSLQCKYHIYSDTIYLTAKKVSGGEYAWEVNVKGKYGKNYGDDYNEVELRQISKPQLKYKELQFVNLYYK